MMEPTPYPHINAFLKTLQASMHHILGDKLVGLYLYGSLVTGDFDNESSDIDLLAATSSDIDQQDFDQLHRMHDTFAANNPAWEGRIEVQYYSVTALQTFKLHASKMGAISPGEPFHIVEAGADWAINWYVVQEKGVTLFGPPPSTLIDHISHAEFMHTVREHALRWRDWIQDAPTRRPSQAYAILTMCRALYTVRHGEQVSKRRAALWAQHELPQWATLIANALQWRAAWREEQAHEASPAETVRFVNFVIDYIEGLSPLPTPT